MGRTQKFDGTATTGNAAPSRLRRVSATLAADSELVLVGSVESEQRFLERFGGS